MSGIAIALKLSLTGLRSAGRAPTPANTAAPVTSGTPTVGQTLSTTDGTWTNSPSGYAYQWKADGASISGATANTYLLTSSEVGKVITCQVTASNGAGAGVALSNSLGPVAGLTAGQPIGLLLALTKAS